MTIQLHRTLLRSALLLFASLTLSMPSRSEAESQAAWGDAVNGKPPAVRGIHLTAWCAGSKNFRSKIEPLLADTELNTVVIAVKEITGDVFVPGVSLEGKSVYVRAIPDLKEYVSFLKSKGIYTIARVVVFHDHYLAKTKPEWAVLSSSPIALAAEKGYRTDVWVNRKGEAWADAYNEKVWDYNINVAMKAAEAGFQEIQFDYIRFPSDGPTQWCRYSKAHSKATAPKALAGFLKKARAKLAPLGVPVSIDVFGLVGSTGDDMGIGQRLSELVREVDVVCPMMYPSHYAKGEYGIKDPNKAPYQTVHRTVKDTLELIKRSSSTAELRPYLQDFSLGVKYTPDHVRDQIQASADNGVHNWLLWNPSCRYTREALLPIYPNPGPGPKIIPVVEPAAASTRTPKSSSEKPAKKPSTR